MIHICSTKYIILKLLYPHTNKHNNNNNKKEKEKGNTWYHFTVQNSKREMPQSTDNYKEA